MKFSIWIGRSFKTHVVMDCLTPQQMTIQHPNLEPMFTMMKVILEIKCILAVAEIIEKVEFVLCPLSKTSAKNLSPSFIQNDVMACSDDNSYKLIQNCTLH